MKICKKCLNPKDESEFGIDKSKKDGVSIYCKDCLKLIREKYKGKYDHNKYYNQNKDKIKEYYNQNKDKIKEYYQDNIEKKKKYRKEYWEENKETLKDKYKGRYKGRYILTEEQKQKYNNTRKERKKIRKQIDPVFKLKESIRKRINKIIKKKGFSKINKTNQILGCAYNEFKTHIESKFESWMNWDNYGLCNNEFNYGWDIDHIVPCASATTEEELLRLNHYTNLRPLCSHINRNIKRDRLDF